MWLRVPAAAVQAATTPWNLTFTKEETACGQLRLAAAGLSAEAQNSSAARLDSWSLLIELDGPGSRKETMKDLVQAAKGRELISQHS